MNRYFILIVSIFVLFFFIKYFNNYNLNNNCYISKNKALIIENNNYHYECLGIGIEFLSTKYSDIDVYLKHYNESDDAKKWFAFFEENYKNKINLNLISCINYNYSDYEHIFNTTLITADHKIYSQKYSGLIHCNNCDKENIDFIIKYKDYDAYSLSSLIKYVPVIKSYFTLYPNNIHSYNNDFFPDINYFIVTSYAQINFNNLNNILLLLDKKLIYSSRSIPKFEYSNILPHENIDTNNLIKCLLYKKIIFYVKDDSHFYLDRTSGILHLASSFNTPIYIPRKLYNLYPQYHNFNFIPFNSDDHLISLLRYNYNNYYDKYYDKYYNNRF
jgi:hypothetical protein